MISEALMHPMAWILLMLALHSAARAWQWTRGRSPSGDRPEIRRWAETLYLAGIPIAAVSLRVVPSVGHMGLDVPARPMVPIGTGVILGLLACLLISAWENDWRPTVGASRLLQAAREGDIGRDKLVELLRRALEFELHWALFRAAALDTGFGSPESGGVGPAMWLAVVLLGIEGWSNPATRESVGSRHYSRPAARSAAFALTSTLAFALSGSSLAGLIAQIIARFALAKLDESEVNCVGQADLDHTVVEPIVVG